MLGVVELTVGVIVSLIGIIIAFSLGSMTSSYRFLIGPIIDSRLEKKKIIKLEKNQVIGDFSKIITNYLDKEVEWLILGFIILFSILLSYFFKSWSIIGEIYYCLSISIFGIGWAFTYILDTYFIIKKQLKKIIKKCSKESASSNPKINLIKLNKKQKIDFIKLILLIGSLIAALQIKEEQVYILMIFVLVSIVYFIVIQKKNLDKKDKILINFMAAIISPSFIGIIVIKLLTSLLKLDKSENIFYIVTVAILMFIYLGVFSCIIYKTLEVE